MLIKEDKELIQKQALELKKVFHEYTTFTNPQELKQLFTNYNAYEISQHWYDEDPPECHKCTDKECTFCTVYKSYYAAGKNKTYNNWIDVWGPGIWDYTQKEANRFARKQIQELQQEEDIMERIFFFWEKNDFCIYYYGRDKHPYCDWFFIMKPKKK